METPTRAIRFENVERYSNHARTWFHILVIEMTIPVPVLSLLECLFLMGLNRATVTGTSISLRPRPQVFSAFIGRTAGSALYSELYLQPGRKDDRQPSLALFGLVVCS
jgi:hypothetical protein